jgi:hypothetical protein
MKRGEDRDVARIGAVLARFQLTPTAASDEWQRYRGDRAGGRLRCDDAVRLKVGEKEGPTPGRFGTVPAQWPTTPLVTLAGLLPD